MLVEGSLRRCRAHDPGVPPPFERGRRPYNRGEAEGVLRCDPLGPSRKAEYVLRADADQRLHTICCHLRITCNGYLGNFSNILSTSLFTRLLWCSGDACSCTRLSARPRHSSSPVRAFSTSTTSVPMV